MSILVADKNIRFGCSLCMINYPVLDAQNTTGGRSASCRQTWINETTKIKTSTFYICLIKVQQNSILYEQNRYAGLGVGAEG